MFDPLMCAVRCTVLCRGVLNVVHGTHDTVNRILDHPDIAAVSFVGGDKGGRYIYERAAANGKRVQVSVAAAGQTSCIRYETSMLCSRGGLYRCMPAVVLEASTVAAPL